MEHLFNKDKLTFFFRPTGELTWTQITGLIFSQIFKVSETEIIETIKSHLNSQDELFYSIEVFEGKVAFKTEFSLFELSDEGEENEIYFKNKDLVVNSATNVQNRAIMSSKNGKCVGMMFEIEDKTFAITISEDSDVSLTTVKTSQKQKPPRQSFQQTQYFLSQMENMFNRPWNTAVPNSEFLIPYLTKELKHLDDSYIKPGYEFFTTDNIDAYEEGNKERIIVIPSKSKLKHIKLETDRFGSKFVSCVAQNFFHRPVLKDVHVVIDYSEFKKAFPPTRFLFGGFKVSLLSLTLDQLKLILNGRLCLSRDNIEFSDPISCSKVRVFIDDVFKVYFEPSFHKHSVSIANSNNEQIHVPISIFQQFFYIEC